MSEVLAQIKTYREIPKGRIAMWLLIGGEAVIFGSIILAYVMGRMRHPEWAHQTEHTIPLLGFVNTFVLLTSSYWIVVAHAAAHKGDLARMSKFMLGTIASGVVFLCIKAYEYSHDIHMGLTMTSPELLEQGKYVESVFWTYYYTMTGFHAIHVIAGMTIIYIVWRKARHGEGLHRVEYAGMYWHFVDVVWIFLFPMLYIAK